MLADGSPFKQARADDCAGFLLWKLTALWQRRLAAVFDEAGITQTQFAILASLRWFADHDQPTTQTVLAEHARIEPMTLSKAIRKLGASGLVIRGPAASDSRAVAVRLSAKGRKLTQRVVIAVENADDTFFGRLGERDLAAFKALTMALVDGGSESGQP